MELLKESEVKVTVVFRNNLQSSEQRYYSGSFQKSFRLMSKKMRNIRVQNERRLLAAMRSLPKAEQQVNNQFARIPSFRNTCRFSESRQNYRADAVSLKVFKIQIIN